MSGVGSYQYAVIGEAVDHSLSPTIHRAFVESMGGQASYGRINTPLSEARATMEAFFVAGGKGLSVTMPLKGVAYELADQVHPRAQAVSAANTLSVQPSGLLLADNTDGLGCHMALQQLGWDWRGKRVLLMGAGGAARAVLPVLIAGGPALLVVANRTHERAETMVQAALYRQPCSALTTARLDHVPDQPYDFLINTVGAGLSGEQLGVSSACVCTNTQVYDISYGERAKPFLGWCESLGGTGSDGLSMLVAQAAYQHRLWHQVMPDCSLLSGLLAEKSHPGVPKSGSFREQKETLSD